MPPKPPVAILFDTFGSVVDWRTSLISELTEFGQAHGIVADWESVAIAWRMGYHRRLSEVVAGTSAWKDLDDILRELLIEIMLEHAISYLSAYDRYHLTRAWHRLRPWPDAVAGIARLKTKFIVGPLRTARCAC